MPSSNASTQQAYPYPRVQQGYHNVPAQQAYPAHQPVFTRPYTPNFGAIPLPTTTAQQGAFVSTETVRRASVNERLGYEEEDEGEGEEDNDDQQNKEVDQKSKSDKGIETKKRKKQDAMDRRDPSRLQDEVAARVFEMAQEYIPPGAESAAFREQFDMLMYLNGEIDSNTEHYIRWNGARSNLRRGARAVPKRKK